ncbi:enoyl-CoA hydratase/isomerase family protein [Neobacillus citreus]|uniref:Enoyl-CoA hydratase-related protein n=1 Tax=Neobacillus citreus TaxID=2833578 RepID=A0A942SVK7_9BACI|nr:enoyl-CoA hydratase-related protein [Neobacillus citreus]MCH6266160.1 enoyl-CoA hydratase-related protein [Neobacillus citreus]
MINETARFETITWEKKGEIGLLTFNRPERYNAISYQLMDEVATVLDSLKYDTDCRVLVLTGAGKAFCSGTDLKEQRQFEGNIKERAPQLFDSQKRLSDLIVRFRQIPQPVIAAVNGVAAGGGMCFALASDVRIAGPNTRFIASFVNVGLSGGELGASYFLPRLVGMSRASELLLTGREVLAEEALQIGLVSRLTGEGGVLPAAFEIANLMLEKSALGLKMTKEILNTTLEHDLEASLQVENRSQVLCVLSGTFEDAIKRFENRKNKK